MFVNTYTTIHSLISLAAIAAGVPALLGLFGARVPQWLTTLFIVLAVATSATGFGFPFSGVLPSHVVGVIALVILAAAIFARYAAHYAGAWRWIYSAGIVASVYLLVFVGVAQIFAKIPVLHNAAPTQSEPPFAIAQIVVLAIFVVLGILAARAFHPDAEPMHGGEFAR
jgi:hypothetical protein